MRFLVYFIGSLLLLSCSSSPKKTLKESIALEEIVYQRTEGLLILGKILNSTPCEETNMLCDNIQLFYTSSQPQLLGLCESRELNLTMATYRNINEEVESLIQDSSLYHEFMLEKLLLNLHKQKKFYLQVLEDRELASLHFYTLDSYLQVMCFVDDMIYMFNKTDTAQ